MFSQHTRKSTTLGGVLDFDATYVEMKLPVLPKSQRRKMLDKQKCLSSVNHCVHSR